MTPQMTGLLDQIRNQLVAEGEEAFGPDSEQDTEHGDGKAGELSADNISDAFDAFDLYMDDIVSDLVDEYDLTDDQAADFVFEVMGEMMDAGELAELPEDADEDEVSRWLGAAKTAGLEARVLAVADEQAED